MISERIDPAFWRERLQRDGRVQIADYLQPAAAERLRDCLEREVPWTLALRDGSGARTIGHDTYAAMDEGIRAALLAQTAAGARLNALTGQGEFRFAYDSYMMVTAYQEGRDPGLVLHRVLELFNSPDYIAFVRALTGDARIRRVNAQATRYRPGHFLRFHTDEELSEGRLYAYVLNLSREWEADWGGLLQFIDKDGQVADTFLPRWNTLSLFAVPAGHTVSMVAPWAQHDRLAITGWFLT
ncbi:2OG-Fe(II) oxygenase [Lysobacter niastensis]|uniref:2OG-Fe(II) oxygenase n=1 Tax=Lysobacter niastensis TaxID=380629 RepID=A0ABS0B3V5_9GAMM|nr:2OG-Fe(II) oxygenase family protein [Lysobacter niastensis]MBF6023156.1 2OG-Fe(II) oxygenase [Lysobacter niastensis]